jgi:hypothetical protein
MESKEETGNAVAQGSPEGKHYHSLQFNDREYVITCSKCVCYCEVEQTKYDFFAHPHVEGVVLQPICKPQQPQIAPAASSYARLSYMSNDIYTIST